MWSLHYRRVTSSNYQKHDWCELLPPLDKILFYTWHVACYLAMLSLFIKCSQNRCLKAFKTQVQSYVDIQVIPDIQVTHLASDTTYLEDSPSSSLKTFLPKHSRSSVPFFTQPENLSSWLRVITFPWGLAFTFSTFSSQVVVVFHF